VHEHVSVILPVIHSKQAGTAASAARPGKVRPVSTPSAGASK
jgi:hypothetical protein